MSDPKNQDIVHTVSEGSLAKNQEIFEETAVPYSKDSHNQDAHHLVYDAEARKNRFKNRSLGDLFTIACSGFALISDGYQNNIMSMLNRVFAIKYPKQYTANMSTSVSNASLVGTIFGQVVIGLTSDYMGRKWSIMTATLFVILGTIMCAASHGVTVEGMFWMLIISRGVTGFGVGAEYPCSSVSANEASNEYSQKSRGGIMVLVTNFPLSMGGPFALIIFLIVNKITGPHHLEALWRTLYAIGAFWPLSVFYFRWKMANSELYKTTAIKKQVPYWLAIKYYWPRLLGTCGCWFLYDFVTFPNGIFSSSIISSVLHNSKDLEKIAEWSLLLGIIAIPGVFAGAFLCDRIGRKYTLMTGFGGYIIFGLIIGCSYDKISKIVPLFIVFYGLMNSMGNLGPGDMMGVTSSESFATPIRGTFYGISAAIGKVGAVVGTKSFTPIQIHLGKKWTFIIAAICGLLGLLCAFFFIPPLDDDDLMEEDIKFANYLRDNGWEGHFGSNDKDEPETETELSYDEN